jgi:MFS family permease
MRSAYRGVLRRGDVLSALIPYVLARLPLTMAPLALLVLTQQQTGSYHRAGLVCGAYALAVAIAAPVLGRLVDRYGQGPVLLIAGLLHATAMVCAAASAEHRHFVLLVLAAVAAGASLPPVTACMRVLWTRLLPDDESRQAGFAIDGVVVEVAELSGPLLVSLLLVVGRSAVAVGVSGVVMGLAALAFRSTTASRAVPVSGVKRSPWGALAVSGVRRLLVVVACSTATIGAVEVAITAFARHHGGTSLAGLYIGVISVGGIVAGLMFGGSDRFGHRHPATVLAAVLLLSAGATASMAEGARPLVMVGTLFVFGAAVAVGVIVQLATMSAIVSDEVRTEAFTWGATANFVGLGVGTAISGWVVDRHGLAAAFVTAAVPTLVAAAMTVVSRATFTASPAAPEVVDVAPDVAVVADEVAALRAHVSDLEAALAAALHSPGVIVGDARVRARRMLDRADAACLEMRERATDDAGRVREAATTAALEILSAAQRDARAILERARREADAVAARAQRAVDGAAVTRPTLHAVPPVVADGDEVAASS